MTCTALQNNDCISPFLSSYVDFGKKITGTVVNISQNMINDLNARYAILKISILLRMRRLNKNNKITSKLSNKIIQ